MDSLLQFDLKLMHRYDTVGPGCILYPIYPRVKQFHQFLDETGYREHALGSDIGDPPR
jgi:hypothetical protein